EVHAFCVLDHRGVLFHRLQCLASPEYHAQSALAPVEIQYSIAGNDFRNTSRRGMSLEFHLPEPVHGGDISLGQIEVIVILRKDMWNQKAVVDDGNRSFKAGDAELFFALVAGGLDVLPEAVKRIQELAQRRN